MTPLMNISTFLGRFHPLLVHLPIGMLLLGVVMHWLSRSQRFHNLRPGIAVTLLLGAVSAIFSCISGWLLGADGEYESTTLDQHRWMGIAVALIAIVYYLLFTGIVKIVVPAWVPYTLSFALVGTLSIAGHLGGTLTHGEGYLNMVWAEKEARDAKKIIPDVQQAMVYNDIIQPMLQQKCYSCHGASKQRGKLRLDSGDGILSGGEEGIAVVPGKVDESILYQRLVLEEADEKHMPPKGRPQFTPAEVELIHWWINTGAAFDKAVSELPQDEKIQPLLLALQTSDVAPAQPDVPEAPVPAADPAIVNRLKEAGATVIPVARGSNYLSVNFVSSPAVSDAEMLLLEPLAAQLVWLKLGGTSITDQAMPVIARLSALTRLSIDNTGITDEGIGQLEALPNLLYLNIVGTKVSAEGLAALRSLQHLRSIYLYRTGIAGDDLTALQAMFPRAVLDTGGYTLPLLEGDTTELKR